MRYGVKHDSPLKPTGKTLGREVGEAGELMKGGGSYIRVGWQLGLSHSHITAIFQKHVMNNPERQAGSIIPTWAEGSLPAGNSECVLVCMYYHRAHQEQLMRYLKTFSGELAMKCFRVHVCRFSTNKIWIIWTSTNTVVGWTSCERISLSNPIIEIGSSVCLLFCEKVLLILISDLSFIWQYSHRWRATIYLVHPGRIIWIIRKIVIILTCNFRRIPHWRCMPDGTVKWLPRALLFEELSCETVLGTQDSHRSLLRPMTFSNVDTGHRPESG